jgi:hypothetical protein
MVKPNADSPPVKEGWMRAEIKSREASIARADGVVESMPIRENCRIVI